LLTRFIALNYLHAYPLTTIPKMALVDVNLILGDSFYHCELAPLEPGYPIAPQNSPCTQPRPTGSCIAGGAEHTSPVLYLNPEDDILFGIKALNFDGQGDDEDSATPLSGPPEQGPPVVFFDPVDGEDEEESKDGSGQLAFARIYWKVQSPRKPCPMYPYPYRGQETYNGPWWENARREGAVRKLLSDFDSEKSSVRCNLFGPIPVQDSSFPPLSDTVVVYAQQTATKERTSSSPSTLADMTSKAIVCQSPTNVRYDLPRMPGAPRRMRPPSSPQKEWFQPQPGSWNSFAQ